MKTKTDIVVRALMLGIPVELSGRTFKLFRNGEDVPLPSEIATAENPWLGLQMNEGACYIGTDVSFQSLVKMAEALPEEKIITIASNITLTETQQNKLRK